MYIGILVRVGAKALGRPQEVPGVAFAAEWASRHVPILYTSPEQVERRGEKLFAEGWSPDLATESWVQVREKELIAIYNRFPQSRDPEGMRRVARACEALAVPFANHLSFRELVQDKWETARVLKEASLPTPATVLSREEMGEAMCEWGRAFLKPRYGAFGEGVYAVTLVPDARVVRVEGPKAGNFRTFSVSAWLEWVGEHFEKDKVILQQAILPPLGKWRGFAVRTLVQRTPEGAWRSHPRVARLSEDDPVANVSRGAQALPLSDCLRSGWDELSSTQMEEDAAALEQRVAEVLAGKLSGLGSQSIVEMGMDLLLDQQQRWWVLEINGFPQGRLRYLARLAHPDFQAAHALANQLPLDCLLRSSRSSPG